MSTSTREKTPLPTISDVERWENTEDIVTFLRTQNIGLKDKHFDILYEQEIDGSVFLGLNVDELIRVGLALGPAKKILALIEKIKGEATTASNQEVQELKEKLTMLQKGKKVTLYFQYHNSRVICFSTDGWEDLTQLHGRLKGAFDDLKGTLDLYKYFIDNREINIGLSKEEFITFVEIHKCSENNPIKIINLRKGVKRSYFEMAEGLPTASELGKPVEFCKQQRTTNIFCYNSRPPSAYSSIPVTLHCSIFGQFKDFCKEDSEKVDNYFTHEFCCEMAKFYKDEDARQIVANNMLSEYFDRPVQPIELPANKKTGGKPSTDGTISFNGPYPYRELNVEYKCELCASKCCPHLENCGYYITFCTEHKDRCHVTNFPCFLVVIAGPYFSVSGAVLSDKAIIDPLTPLYPLAWHKDDEIKLSISKTFRALKKSLQLLDQYYAEVDDKLLRGIPQTFNPEHPSFPEVIIDDKCYNVQIEEKIVNCLWKATLSNEQGSCENAYVKAIQKHKYSLDAHQLLAEVGYAPKILATSFIPGNWLLVYMEYLNNHLMLCVTNNLKGQSNLKEKIEKVVKYMHDSDYVHGDLREGNILFCRLENDEFDVKLIDFEWSGKVGSARYSHFMNYKITWADGAEDGKLVTKNHDLFMLNQTLWRTGLS